MSFSGIAMEGWGAEYPQHQQICQILEKRGKKIRKKEAKLGRKGKNQEGSLLQRVQNIRNIPKDQ